MQYIPSSKIHAKKKPVHLQYAIAVALRTVQQPEILPLSSTHIVATSHLYMSSQVITSS